MRGINVIVCAALLLVAIALAVLTEGAARWLAAPFALAAIFFAWRWLSTRTRGVAEEEARTHTQGRENRMR